MRGPKRSITRKPRIDFCESAWIERVHATLCVLTYAYQARGPERTQVLRYSRLRQREALREVPGGSLALGQQVDDVTPSGIRKCRERFHIPLH